MDYKRVFYTQQQRQQDKIWLITMMHEYRKDLWVSQQELADSIGMTQSAIARIETGIGNPSFTTLMRIARLADMRIDFVR